MFIEVGAAKLGHFDNDETVTEDPMSAPLADLDVAGTDGAQNFGP